MKRALVFVILLVVAAIIVVGGLFLRDMLFVNAQPHPTVDLWAEGRYEIPPPLMESGIIQVDTSITDPNIINEGAHFDFQLRGVFSYFKIVVFRSEPGLTPMLGIELSNGQHFFMSFALEEGASYIIYSAEPWPEGTHRVSLHNWAPRAENTYGEVHITILTATSLEAVKQGLTPPPQDSILVIEPVEGTIASYGGTFMLRNNSPYRISQNHNYYIERKVNGYWERILRRDEMLQEYVAVWAGGMQFSMGAGGVLVHSANWEGQIGRLPSGEYRIVVPRMSWRWTNDYRTTLTKTIPLHVEFTIP